MKRGGKCRGEEWSRGRRQRGRLGRREVIFTKCSGQASDLVAFVWRRPKMVCQQARERQAQPRQTSNNSLRRQVTREPLRGPRWWGFGARSGVRFSLSAPPAPLTDAGTAPWGFTHRSAEGWRGWTLIRVDMNKATEIHKHSGAPWIKTMDTLAGWFSYLGGQSRMHQQWKKHSGFSEHIYAENSRRRFCLSEFSTVDIQTGLPSQFLAGVLKLTKKGLGRAVLPADPGLHLLPRMSENEAGGRGQTQWKGERKEVKGQNLSTVIL